MADRMKKGLRLALSWVNRHDKYRIIVCQMFVAYISGRRRAAQVLAAGAPRGRSEEERLSGFELSGVEVPGSTKASGFLDVPGTPVRMPFTAIAGTDGGPAALITGGVHGGEYPGIEAAMRLARELEPGQLRGTVVIIHPVSPPAFHARQQYVVPHDGKNLNRQFPGKALGTVSERMAWTVMEVARRVDAWVDLHGGDIHEALVPFTIYSDVADREVVAASRSMADVYGIHNVIASASVKGGTYSAAAAAGIPCILAEAGQVGQLDEDSVAVHLRGCRNVLRHLGCLRGKPDPVGPVRALRRFEWRFAEEDGCWYPSVGLGAQVQEGQPVGVVRDYFGNTLREYHAPTTGVVLFLVTSLAMNAGDPLLAVGAE
jgi:predicted deacylase